jgi:glycosyltransferase involved in cell wall biosynthesis
MLLQGKKTHVIVPSRTLERVLIEKREISGQRVSMVDPAIDTSRFDPDTCGEDKRRDLGLTSDDFVIGIVARVQRHRRFAELLEGIRRARQNIPSLKMLIVGRGTHLEEIAVQPVKRMGLDATVFFAGYQTGDDYVRTLKSFDAKIFLMPGTDGTCRAVREALCMGKPVIAARRGMLPDLVEDGRTGLLIDDTPDNIAQAVTELASDRRRCHRMGHHARHYAVQRFSALSQAEKILEIYEQVTR